jgi:hypothetical protein
MLTTSFEPIEPIDASPELTLDPSGNTQRAIGWSSAFFVLLQSICTAVIAINAVRLAIGWDLWQ